MSGANGHSRHHIWDEMIVPMLEWLEREVAPTVQGRTPWWDEVSRSRTFTYQELADRSGGLDFTSDGPTSVRSLLYVNREEIQKRFRLYFDDAPGGIRWTMLPQLGMWWRHKEAFDRTRSVTSKSYRMSHEAHGVVSGQMAVALFKPLVDEYRRIVAAQERADRIIRKLFGEPPQGQLGSGS